MSEWMSSCTIAISADFSGLGVTAMTALRRVLREQGVHLRVVKNRLALLAADAAGRTLIRDIVEGPTAIAFGFDDPAGPAKALADYIRTTRLPLAIRGGVMGERALTAAEVNRLATLPSKEELVARLMARIQAPAGGLVNVLQAPVSGLARVLQRHAEAVQDEAAQDEAAPGEAAPDEAAPGEAAQDEAAPGEAAQDEAAPGEVAQDEAPEDEAPEDEAPEDETPQDEVAQDEAPEDETAEGEVTRG